jgi:hypothetical protein
MTRESILKRLDKLKERKKNNPNYPQAAIDKELKFWQGQLKKLPTSPANIKLNKPDDFAKDIVKKKSPVKPKSDVKQKPIGIRFLNSIIDSLMAGSNKRTKKKMFDKIKNQKEFRDAYLGTNTPSQTKIKKLVRKNIVSERPPVIKSNKKMTDKVASLEKDKENKKFRAAYLGTNQSSEPKNKKLVRKNIVSPKPTVLKDNKTVINKQLEKMKREKIKSQSQNKVNKRKPPTDQQKRLSKIASKNITATNKKQSSNGIAGPSISSSKRPASIIAGSGKGLGTLSEIASKYGTTIKELMKANKDITDADKIQKGQKIELGKVVKNRKSVYQKKSGGPVVKKMGGGKVFRRGGGKALRGFGNATYSNKLY